MRDNHPLTFCLGGAFVAVLVMLTGCQKAPEQVPSPAAHAHPPQSPQAQPSEEEIIRQFNILYYSKADKTWGTMKWFGFPTQKYPTDMWIYQEIMFELKPDLILETGTFRGGSALYMAHLCDQLGKGKIVTFDILNHQPRPVHPRIEYVITSSTSKEAEAKVKQHVKAGDVVLVVLDSDHSKTHVLNELKLFSKYVSVGSYLIVEDSNVGGHPAFPEFGPGPMEAMDEFMRGNKQYEVDSFRERLMVTANPKGFLKRLR